MYICILPHQTDKVQPRIGNRDYQACGSALSIGYDQQMNPTTPDIQSFNNIQHYVKQILFRI